MVKEARLYETFELEVSVEPYNFKLTAQTYNFSWWYNGSSLIIPLDNVLVKVDESDKENTLVAKIYSHGNVEYDLDVIVEETAWILGLHENLSEFYDKASKDSLLGKAAEKLRGYHVRATSLWNALLIGVCQQNASFRQGWRMLYEIYRRLGQYVVIPGYGETLIPPQPKTIVEKGIGPLIEARTGYRAQTIYRIARFLEETPSLPREPWKLKQFLLEVKGVGEYTVRLSLVLSKRYYEEPPIDRWLKEIIIQVHGVDESNVEDYYRRVWGKWAGLAALLTTIALDAETLRKALARIMEGRTVPEEKDKPTPLTLWKYF